LLAPKNDQIKMGTEKEKNPLYPYTNIKIKRGEAIWGPTNQPTDQPINGPTNGVSYRGAWSRLKITSLCKHEKSKWGPTTQDTKRHKKSQKNTKTNKHHFANIMDSDCAVHN
jgi:hypothetical protein